MLEDNFKFHIVGAGRGGTSLLAGLLDYHSQLEVAFEAYSIACLMGKELVSKGSELLKQRVTAYIAGCNQLAKQHPNVFWGNKITTEQIHGLEDQNKINQNSKIDILDEFFNKFLEERKVIFIMRDGRTCINSKVQRTGQSMEQACKRWQYSVKCYKFFKTCHSNNICIRFEDLLIQPRETLTNICDFLNVSYQEEMLTGSNNKKMLPEYRKNELDKSKMISINLPEPFLQAINDDMKYCGYL